MIRDLFIKKKNYYVKKKVYLQLKIPIVVYGLFTLKYIKILKILIIKN